MGAACDKVSVPRMITDPVALAQSLSDGGGAVLPSLLSADECAAIQATWHAPALFRSEVNMARHGFGQGTYRYFADPMPERIAALRTSLYPALAATANRWAGALGTAKTYPASHAEYRTRCHAAGQSRPTPLLLRYGPGDWNALHQDLYGAEVFPLQIAILLSEPDSDFIGGEFVLTEQRPRMQSRAAVVPLRQGDAVVFPVRERPVQGARGPYRVQMRHGVSKLHSGERFTLGIIFHDAA
jgi:uncharacterized protein